ncbi:unnamed protein product [marine sediment metagenome]|uniref:Uncharacterized protein n=1 Tax=marine sediment metagenome TaxID=412755 RepID=X1JRI1_9ZZZZ
MDFTWGNAGAIFGMLVMISFVAGFVDVWWEQRKREKNKRG